MKSLCFFILALAFVCSMTSCHRKSCGQQALMDTFAKKNKALMDDDVTTLASIATKDISFTHSNGWVEDYRSFISGSQNKQLFYNAITLDSTYAFIHGQTGIIRGSGIFDIVYKNNALQVKLAFTETYFCEDHDWKLLSRHSSKL